MKKTAFLAVFMSINIGNAMFVPVSKSRNIPEVVLEGAGQLGFWEFGGEGWVG
jgi:hypothetical protein